YISIAQRGYVLEPVNGSPPAWSGNTGWLPLYAWTVRAFATVTHARVHVAAMVLSELFALLTLVYIWNLLLPRAGGPHKWLALLLAGFFPGMIYQHAPYPISLATLLLAICL